MVILVPSSSSSSIISLLVVLFEWPRTVLRQIIPTLEIISTIHTIAIGGPQILERERWDRQRERGERGEMRREKERDRERETERQRERGERKR
jgi:hypothetical protein